MPMQVGREKVAIVGFCDSSRNLTPWHDPSYEVWHLNRAHLFAQPSQNRIVPGSVADRWFDMHEKGIRSSPDRRPGKHMEFLAKFPGPVYLHSADPDLPNAVVYPLKEIAEHFGGNLFRHTTKPPFTATDTKGSPYLTSSIALELALAIYEGFSEIFLTGVDLNTESEYGFQKPAVEFWLGVAMGQGIKVVLPDNCPLLKGNIYGRGYMSKEAGPLMSYDQLKSRRKSIELELQQHNTELQRVIGARTELEHLMAQMTPGLDHEMCDQRRQKMQIHENQMQAKLLQVQGAMKETVYWLHQTPNGQEPGEAVEQLEKVQLTLPDLNQDEGPLTDLEELQTHYETPVNINGYRAPELIGV